MKSLSLGNSQISVKKFVKLWTELAKKKGRESQPTDFFPTPQWCQVIAEKRFRNYFTIHLLLLILLRCCQQRFQLCRLFQQRSLIVVRS